VIVQIEGLRSTQGQLQVALFRGPGGFPETPQRAFARRVVGIAGSSVRLEFDGVPAGQIAITAHHDEDGDGRMRRKLFGQPAEGYAISRDAKGTFGPPKFKDAEIMLRPGEQITLAIHMRY
jgi:uncharacterized protein (DUF2141 family)